METPFSDIPLLPKPTTDDLINLRDFEFVTNFTYFYGISQNSPETMFEAAVAVYERSLKKCALMMTRGKINNSIVLLCYQKLFHPASDFNPHLPENREILESDWYRMVEWGFPTLHDYDEWNEFKPAPSFDMFEN